MKKQFVLEHNQDNLLSPWEINEILKDISGLYFKNELLLNIKKALNKGVNPSHIWILNESVKSNHTYSTLKNGVLSLNNDQQILDLYHMGSPMSLFPDKHSYQVFLAFEYFRNVYRDCYRKELEYPNKKEVVPKVYQVASSDGSIDTIKSELKKLISRAIIKQNPSPNREIKNQNQKKIDDILNNRQKLLESFDDTNILLKELEMTINIINREGLDIGLEKTQDMLKKYDSILRKFNEYFKKIQRPFVVQYQPQENSLLIFNYKMISKKFFQNDNEQFFETNKIEQNSPCSFTASVAASFLPSLFILAKSQLKKYKEERDHMEKTKNYNEEYNRLNDEITEIDKMINDMKEEVEQQTVTLNDSPETCSFEQQVKDISVDSIHELELKNNEDTKRLSTEKKLVLKSVYNKE